MTDDVDLARLAAHVELAGAKLVLSGDHRQLGAVAPGGALGALVARHPEAVHHLKQNRRQHDPEERRALEALRDGDVAEAVSWYAGNGRVHAVEPGRTPSRLPWTPGRLTWRPVTRRACYAWRRANVAELNRRARAWMEASGRLSGPELPAPAGPPTVPATEW